MNRLQYIIAYGILLLQPFMVKGQEIPQTTLSRARHFTNWQLSSNPAGIAFIPLDSLLEASIEYNYNQQSLSRSDRPSKEQTYGATTDGYCRFGLLQLTGGLSWRQNQKEGVYYNFLQQPDYLVAAGDTLGEPERTEHYRIYGKAAYGLTSSLKLGIGGDYTAIYNKDDSPEKRYTGNAHTTTLSAGLIYETSVLRSGISVMYTHRTELLSYGVSARERLYTYPLGYYLQMGDFNAGERGFLRAGAGTSYVFRSIGNQWQSSLQAEWIGNGWNWFNTISAGLQKQKDNPDSAGNMKGWEEVFSSFGYQSRLSLNRGQWTHLLTPSFYWQYGTSDRILQHINYEVLSGAWETYATYRLASRTKMSAEFQYEIIQDYTPALDKQAWEITAGWYRRQEKFYSFPMTIAQTTNTIRATFAYRHTFALPSSNRLILRPFFTAFTGFGTEEETSQPTGTPETENTYPRSNDRVSTDFAAQTATRLLIGLQADFLRKLSQNVSAGIRLFGNMEQITGNKNDTNGRVGLGIYIEL